MVVKRSQAAQGHDGEQLHVRGPRMEMRVWENVPRGYHFAPHDCASERPKVADAVSEALPVRHSVPSSG